MTAPDPRLDEIQARVDAVTPGPWKARRGGDFQNIRLHAGSLWIDVVDSSGQIPPHGEFVDSPDIDFIESAPTDVRYLLAELRKAHEALARVEALADDAEPFKGLHGYTSPGAVLAEDIYAAVAAAKGNGE